MQKRTKVALGIILLILLSTTMAARGSSSSVLAPLPQSTSHYPLSTHSNLSDPSYLSAIDSFFTTGRIITFSGQMNVPIYTMSFIQPVALAPMDSANAADSTHSVDSATSLSTPPPSAGKSIIISSGRTEAAVKYKELIFDLYNSGYSIFILDHRGQGLSGRMTEDHDMGYVEDFSYYVDDMKCFYDSIVLPTNPSATFLLAHSLGGGIAAAYLETYPADFTAAALSSPMLGLPFPTCQGIGLFVKKSPNYAPGMKPYAEYDTAFATTKLTTDELRLSIMNSAFDSEPKAVLGGASAQWVQRSCREFKVIHKNTSAIVTPLILFSAGQEQIVSTKAHKKFIAGLQKEGKDAVGYAVPGAKHEIFIEADTIRNPMLTTVLDFFGKY